MSKIGINMENVKLQNRSAILRFIQAKEPVSRKDIALATGLTPAAVTLICAEFIESGLLHEIGTSENSKSAGRKKILLEVNKNYCHLFVICIEKQETVISVTNLAGNLVAEDRLPTDCSAAPRDFLKKISIRALKLLADRDDIQEQIKGVSVTVPGIIDKIRGSSLHAFGIWSTPVPVRDIFEENLGLPVVIENNVNALAQAELLYGAGREQDDFLLIKWGPGVGCSIVADRNIYDGKLGKAGELGHCIVEKNGRLCSCGKSGCLETKISFAALQEKYRKSGSAALEFTAMEHFGAVYQGQDNGLFFEEEMDLFACMIVNCLAFLGKEYVVLCGKLFSDEAVRQALIKNCMAYDSKISASDFISSPLIDRELYIGGTASFLTDGVFGE